MIRIVAVNGSTRLDLLPDVPTYAELGTMGYEEVIFTAVFAPAGTPVNLIQSYNAAISKVVKSAEFIEKLAGLRITAASSTSLELVTRVQETNLAWNGMVPNEGYQAQQVAAGCGALRRHSGVRVQIPGRIAYSIAGA